MALSLSSINDAINSYNKKISERVTFISNSTKLIDDANKSSQKLGEASSNLALALTIGGQPVDNGELNDMVVTINKNVSALQGTINIANAEIKIFKIKISNLKAEKERIIQAIRDANREKSQENIVVRKALKEEIK